MELRKAFQKDKLQFHGELQSLTKPAAFEALLHKAGQIEWVVYAKRPFGGPEQVLKYLARYTHRVAISNRRLLSLENHRVAFEWKDYADRHQIKTMTLEAVEFIRRFLLHVLPAGFVRIRHFGFLANRVRKEKLKLCRSLLSAQKPATQDTTFSPNSSDSKIEQPESGCCPICKVGRLIFVTIVEAEAPLRATKLPLQDTS